MGCEDWIVEADKVCGSLYFWLNISTTLELDIIFLILIFI